MRKAILIVLTFCAISTSGIAQDSFGLTLFGTDLISAEELRSKYQNDLDEMFRLYKTDYQKYLGYRIDFIKKLEALDQFGYVYLMFLKSYTGPVDLIIDFVEKDEMSERLNFREIKSERLEDPDGLIERWKKYESLSNEIFNKGELGSTACPVFHCTWAFDHSDLKPYLKYFSDHVAQNKDNLVKTLNHSDSSGSRAAAAFLLAHADVTAQELVDLLRPSIRDPHSGVRNNSMRVIYYVVKAHSNIELNLDEIIRALDYPSFTDRNKALIILRSLPLDNLDKDQLTDMIPILIEVLERNEPSGNASAAHRILKKVSKKAYRINDIESWKDWATLTINN